MRRNFLFISIIILVTLIIYMPGLSAPFVFDDIGGIVNNQSIKNVAALNRIWQAGTTRFVTNLSFAANYHLSGLHLFEWHLTNLTIHLLTVITLYFFVLKISKNSLISFLSAFTFAVHPIDTQAVTYIVQRAASLATLFYLLTLYFYLKSADNRIYLAVSILFAILAFYSKEISFTLPLSILLTDIFLIKRSKHKIHRLLFFFLFLALLILTVTIQTGLIKTPRNTLTTITQTTGQHSSKISRWEYLISEISVIGLYLKLLIFPVNQNFDYDLPQKIALSSASTLISLIPITFLLLFAFLKKNKYPLLCYSIFLFFTTLLVESSVFPIEDLAFEYRLYLPMLGFSIAAGYLLYQIITIYNKKSSLKILIFILFTLLSFLTFQRNQVLSSEISLWSDTAGKSPDKPRVRMSLAAAYTKQGRLNAAIKEYENLLTLDPLHKNLAYNNLGLIYLNLKNKDKAEEYFKQALNEDPKDIVAANNLANLVYQNGNKEEAISQYNKIIEISPGNLEAHRSLAYIDLTSGKIEEAIAGFEQISGLPDATDISFSELGDVYRSNNNLPQAIIAYNQALNLNTRNELALIGLGKTYLLLGKNMEAKSAFSKAFKINPRSPDALSGLEILRGNSQ